MGCEGQLRGSHKKRVNIQTEKADPQYIIDGQW